MRERLFTSDEVNALIPTLERLVRRVQECGADLRRLVIEARSCGDAEASMPLAEMLRSRPDAVAAADTLQDLLREVAATGGQFKGIDLGLVDFPAEIGGERVLLCWQYGESEVCFYHSAADGFAGRKPLQTSRPRFLQ